MSRARGKKPLAISLFPFLAVLICTMGALILLLVLMVQKARFDRIQPQAVASAVRPVSAAADEDLRRQAQQRLEDAAWREELLRQQRDQQLQTLADRRQQLSHLEDHLRRLQEQAEQLLAQAQAADAGKQLSAEQLAAAKRKLAELQQEIEKKQAEIEKRRKEDANRDKWYALVPYDGPNGTRRRPIYIECTEEGVILQPEGVVFTPADFAGPLGSGNPLDAALRTKREFLTRGGAEAGQAYPLLVVRPSGVVAYQAARQALQSWDEEFGYELVAEDKQLVFGDGDRALEAMLQQTVNTARVRQRALAEAMPKRYAGDSPLVSFSPDVQPDVVEARSAGGFGGGGSGGIASGVGLGGRAPGSPGGLGSGSGLPGTGLAGGGGGSGGFPGMESAGASGLSGENGTGGTGSSGTGGAGGFASGSPGGQQGGQPGGAPASGPYAMNASPGGSAGGAAGGTMGGSIGAPSFSGVAMSPAGAASGGSASGGTPASGAPGQPSSASGPGGGSSTPTSGKTAQRGSATSSGGQPGGSGGMASGAGRGQNWGLPNSQGRTTAITRPIQVACQADRLVIYPDKGDARRPAEIAVSPQMTLSEVNAFVSTVQREINGWGIAVSNGYWKPVLQVDVAPDAEGRFQTLQTALQGSGFDVQRKIR